MKQFCLILITIIMPMHSSIGQSYEARLIPYPEKAAFSEGKFLLSRDFCFSITGNPDKRLFDASNRFLNRLDGRTGLFFNQWITPATNPANVALTIRVNRPGMIRLNEDESYHLAITTGNVALSAETDLGAMHGLETLLQLLSSDGTNYYFPVCTIDDQPRFPWRGLMMDAGRHFMPVDVIKRNIDGIAAVKMNVLHLHLTEDQGFRIESKIFPELAQQGSDGLYYTQDQIRDIIQYANDRGIRVIPEFDMPGHATSWVVSHPELASAPGPYSIERRFGVFDPTMNPTKEETYVFLDKFIGEMAALFNDEYLHIGGDENNGKQWNENADIQSFMKANDLKDDHALQAYFNRRLLTILNKYNKKMIGWDEIMQPEIPRTAVIQSWRGKSGLTAAAKAGYQVLLSNGYYIDLVQKASDLYLNDPLPAGIDLTEEQKKLILGGETTMWTELVTTETVDSRIWPRTAAIAERLWSPASVSNLTNMYQKLDVISLQLEELGLTHRRNQDVLLRRMCQSNDIAPLIKFVNLVEPVKLYERTNSTFLPGRIISPFTRMVDAARPDAPEAMIFNARIEQYLIRSDKNKYNELVKEIQSWTDNNILMNTLITQNPILKELEPIVKDMNDCSKIALEALKMIEKNKKAPAIWSENASLILAESHKHKAHLELAILPGVEKLVEYVKK